MRSLIPILALLFYLGTAAACAQVADKAVVGGTLIDPHGVVDDAVILIDGDQISEVGTADGVRVPEGAEVIDAEGAWVIPGLIDSHVHFFQSGGLYTRPDVIDLRHRVPYEDELRRIGERLEDTFQRYLASGVTGVADMGGPFWNFEVRERARQASEAPRVAVAGPLISTYQPPELTTDDPPIIEVESPEEARELVRQQAEREADFIKVWYIVRAGESPDDHLPIVEATAAESQRHGISLAVHATQLETARAAVNAGADILVHSVTDRPVDDAFVDLLLVHDVIYTPTLVVFERYPMVLSQQLELTEPEREIAHPDIVSSLFDLGEIPEDELPPGVVQQTERAEPVTPPAAAMENLATLHAAGVTIAAGTDAGNIGTLHGPSIFRELQLMQQAGLTPEEILTTVTINGAQLMGMADEIGIIEAGKRADLVLLNSDPRTDIMNTADIRQVLRGGTVFSPEALLGNDPVEVVERQLDAYNARDVEAFLETYHPDARIYDYPDELRMSGHEEMRQTYNSWFESAPDLHAEITERITAGPYVIDRERITGTPGGEVIEAVAIYHVQDGLIREVRFLYDEEPFAQ